jgi:hypothetical protein
MAVGTGIPSVFMCNHNSWCQEAIQAFFSGEWDTEVVPQINPFFTPIMIVSSEGFALAMFCVN